MGRLSDKAKHRKQLKKEEKLKQGEYQMSVVAAKAQADPLSKFELFRKFTKDGVEYSLSCLRAGDLSDELKEWAFDLTQRNMARLYLESLWGWDPQDKKDDLYHKDAWFLLAVDSEDVPVGFVNFRYDMDYGLPVAYCYEIQLERGVRRHGLGRHMMKVLELLAFSARMLKVVLTVFQHNEEGRPFFLAMGYTFDETSPSGFDDVGFGEGKFDYDILSKVNKRMMDTAKASPSPTPTQTARVENKLAEMNLNSPAGRTRKH